MATMNEIVDFIEANGGKLPPFSRKPWYERHTDSLIFYFEDTPSYGNRLNQLFTLFLSDSGDRLVGIEIKGFMRLISRMKQGGIEILATNKAVRLKKLTDLAYIPEPEMPELMHHLERFDFDFDVEMPEFCAAQ
jgi:hypothetical protein